MFLQEDYNTPLHIAAMEGCISIANVLLEEGTDVNVMDEVS